MKKMIWAFVVLFFSNISIGWGAFFYADALERAIMQEFPSELQSVVANEYEAQMNQETGEIDENGMYNVCYAGGYDVSTFEGAEKCKGFVQKIDDECVYAIGTSMKYYNNPKTKKEKIQKCIFEKAMNFVFKYGGGFQQNPRDPGNRIHDGKGGVLKNPDGTPVLGATKYDITTWSSGLSVECIKNMTKDDAKAYYWTHHIYKYNYYKLPDELIAGVFQLSVGGVGKLAKELKEVVGAQHCDDERDPDNPVVVLNACVLFDVDKYMGTHTVKEFYDTIHDLRADKYTNDKVNRNRALAAKEQLVNVYSECVNAYK